MPAYRSAAEAEVRDAVVARLRVMRPSARIIHEIQCACWGPNRIDVVAVSASEIIAVEVKSSKDKLDRLPAQIEAMAGMSHHVIAALHEKHLVTNAALRESCRADVAHLLNPPPEARGAEVWAWPEAGAERDRTYGCARWQDLRPAIQAPLPFGALDMLWQAELVTLCGDLGMRAVTRDTRPQMMARIRWGATGAQITKGICRALRQRQCVEADPPICEAAA